MIKNWSGRVFWVCMGFVVQIVISPRRHRRRQQKLPISWVMKTLKLKSNNHSIEQNPLPKRPLRIPDGHTNKAITLQLRPATAVVGRIQEDFAAFATPYAIHVTKNVTFRRFAEQETHHANDRTLISLRISTSIPYNPLIRYATQLPTPNWWSI